MATQAKLNKWGNSLAVRIPSKFLKQLDLNAESKIQISAQNNRLIIEKYKDLSQMCKAINAKNLNIDSEFSADNSGKEW